jgi:hypothetical protein
VSVTDDQGAMVSCPLNTLAPDEGMTCTASGMAAAGQYANVGSVTGSPPVGEDVSASDASHYFGAIAEIALEKRTNGEDADSAPGPTILAGARVDWTYEVANAGNVALTGVSVVDDQEVTVSCPQDGLAPGEGMTCSASEPAAAGAYANLGTVTGTPAGGLPDVSASDPSHYFGAVPGIAIEKRTNGQDADSPPGPYIPVGDAVRWAYEVTNTGGITLTGVTVVDDQGVAVNCPTDVLGAGEAMTCAAEGTASAGPYANVGTARGTPPGGDAVSASDTSHYYGTAPELTIEKRTNGEDADSAPGPYIPVGDAVSWDYAVRNTGNVTLTNVSVTDDRGVTVSCPGNTLAPDEGMTCSASGTAAAGQYANVGTASGTPPVGEDASASDPSHYFGAIAEIGLEKRTNGEDADSPPGPAILAGTWTGRTTSPTPGTWR